MYSTSVYVLCRFSLEQHRHVPFDCCPDLARARQLEDSQLLSTSLGANGVLQELRGDVQKVLGNKRNRLNKHFQYLSIQYSLK